MSFIRYDFKCTECGHVDEDVFLRRTEVESYKCTKCSSPSKRLPCVPTLDWRGLDSPEAARRFARVHREQKAKEEKSFREHGDYGPRPGAD